MRLHEFCRTSNNNYFFFEYCGGGDLRGLLKEKQKFDEITTQRMIRQIASGLRVMYEQNIIHRDLKPQNILLSEKTENAILKLADFGLAKEF